MADNDVTRALPTSVQHRSLDLVEAAVADPEAPLAWRIAGADVDELRELLVVTAKVAAVLARYAARSRRESPAAVVSWVRDRVSS